MIFFENLIFLIFLIFFSTLSVSTQNIIHSILYLILSFLSSVFLFFLIECEFIAFIFLLIYVGAIAMLFLFSIMLLNIKITDSNKNLFKFYPIGLFFGFVLFFEFLFNFIIRLNKNFFSFSSFFENSEFYFNWFENIDNGFNIEVFGLILYSYFFIQLLIVGFILLLAILGTIVLTFDKNTVKQKERNQYLFKQIVRNY